MVVRKRVPLSAAPPALLRGALLLGAVLLGLVSAGAATAQVPDPPTSRSASDAPADRTAEAAYQFAIAKMLAESGSLSAAREAFAEAARLAPDDPYVRTEHGELLRRMAARSRPGSDRAALLEAAVAEAEAAAALAPDNPEVLRSLAQVHLSLADARPGSLEAAVAALEKVRGIAPWDLQSMIPLGQIYMQSGRPEGAAGVFAEAADHTPDSRIVYSMLADALRAAGRDADAAAALERLLVLDPGSLDARVSLARLLAQVGDPARAVEVLRAAPADVRQSSEVSGELAWQLYRMGDLDAALTAAQTSLEADPANRWLRLVHALVLGGLGETGEALEGIAELRGDDPDNLELVRAAAGLLERDGRPEEAERLYRDLLGRLAGKEGRRPMADRTRLLIAGIEARRGDVEAAIGTLAPVLDTSDSELRLDATIAYADLLHEAGRDAEALAAVRGGDAPELAVKELDLLLAAGDEGKARKLARRLNQEATPQIRLHAAQAAQRREAYELSLPLLETVIESAADDINALFLYGAGLERTGRHDDAVVTFEKLLASEPDFAPALNYLGYMWAERGQNLARALELVQRAVALDPDNGAYVDSLGWAYYRMGNFVEAREKLERAVELVPEDPVIFDHLGDVYAALGDTRKAAELYRRALTMADGGDLDPVTVRRKLDELDTD